MSERRNDTRTPSHSGILRFRQHGFNYNMLVVDESAHGMGCLYQGGHPPKTGPICFRPSFSPDVALQVRWVHALGLGLYKIGLRNAPVAVPAAACA